jgi:CheY-like chemotaxis protein
MSQQSPYVLFADDDPDDLELLIPPFIEANPGVSAAMAATGDEIVNWLESCSADELPLLILLDYKIGHKTAADILRWLNSKKQFRQIPRFVWSTSGRQDHINECLSLGALGYLSKPADNEMLKTIIWQLTSAVKKLLSVKHSSLAENHPFSV